ncbi:LamG-like jellyroll fold domain-containing protein [Alienimonas chondri]|uniref:FecR protein domain-containing protein n=1 Tax=Alienimonas chondri TaxID=2681879 RepID=A0ABX1VJC0_9PLAN|nr:LamG-like jellyroll fold domain-containing protein [Alienimonas chondri]NNJ27877.1 hypothetical protein [Alienimonas chondri]
MNDLPQELADRTPERTLLLEGFLDGTLSEANALTLEAELSVDPAFRQRLYERLTLESLLEEVAGETGAQAPAVGAAEGIDARPELALRSHARRPALRRIALAALALAACLLVGAFLLSDRGADPAPVLAEGGESEPVESERVSGFGVVTGQEDAAWVGRRLRTGDLAPGGPLRLESGTAHLELFSGVRLLVRGPAAFTVDSPMQLTLRSGRIQARVPEPAVGFRVQTAAGELVDLGTEFAVEAGDGAAGEAGSSESTNDVRVRVLDGAVTLAAGQREAQLVEPGAVWRWTAQNAAPDAAATLTAEPLIDARRRLADQRNRRRAEWKTSRDELLNDPRLFAFYAPGDAAESGVVPNLATANRSVTASDGVVIAAEPAPDRWEQEGGALDVSRPGSRMRLAVEGESAGLTLLCWVRIGSLDRDYNSLLLSDGHRARSPHWQLLRDGRLFFSLKLPDDVRAAHPSVQTKFHSPPVWTPARSGRWQMLAVTYDPVAAEICHYADGVRVGRQAVDPVLAAAASTVSVGRATVGNWTDPVYSTDPKFTVRNFNGRIGELAAFAAPLSAAEIHTLFEKGRPDAD